MRLPINIEELLGGRAVEGDRIEYKTGGIRMPSNVAYVLSPTTRPERLSRLTRRGRTS